MAEGLEHVVVSGKLRRRAAILMTGAALGGFYIWMQPAALGTLEANSAQAADGSSGCVLKVGSTPLTVGGREVRVQSNELCGNTANLAAPPMPVAKVAAPPADLLRATIREDVRIAPPPVERFAGAAPRVKPEALALASLGPEPQIAEAGSHREDLEREHLRADAAPEPSERPDDDEPDTEHEDGGEHAGTDNDGGEHSGGDRDCNEREVASRDWGDRDSHDWGSDDRDGGERSGGEGGGH